MKPLSETRRKWVELQVLRKKDGYNLTGLAKAAEMSLSYLSELESGARKPNPGVIAKLAKTLNVPKSMLEPRDDTEDAA